jgi:ATP-dependent DNA helicase RecQ
MDSLVLLPTGGGKSLIYQLAALLHPGLTLVVAPLVALMEDQVDNLARAGIDRAAAINATTSLEDRDGIEERLRAGNLMLCYIAPERLQIERFRRVLVSLKPSLPIPLIVVDEAHCVSEWGHDFRPAYLNLARIGRMFGRRAPGEPPILIGLTGTASRSVLRDVQVALGIDDIEAVITPENFDRPNLHFEVQAVKSDAKLDALEGVLRGLPGKLGGVTLDDLLAARGIETMSGMIFCPHIRGAFGVESVAAKLENKFQARVPAYSGGGLAAHEKSALARRFKDNDFSLLVATKSMGMGIDKPNVRYTVHYGLPQSLEAFYQEAGRSGRNGEHSICTVLASIDHPDLDERLLSPGLEADELCEEIDGLGRGTSDDIIRSLWFHTQAFGGAESDIDAVKSLIARLRPLTETGTIILDYGDGREQKEMERALHRLVALEVVTDYRVDYGRKQFSIDRRAVKAEDLHASLFRYVGGYSRKRAEKIAADTFDDGQDVEDALRRTVKALVDFVYETVEAGRRAAIRQVWRWSESGNRDDTLRQGLLEYLQETEFSRDVNRLLLEQCVEDVEPWRDLLEMVSSTRDQRELKAAINRGLEDYPDQPMLLALAAILDANPQFAVSTVVYLRDRYGGDEDQLASLVSWLVSEFLERSPDALPGLCFSISKEEQDEELITIMLQYPLPSMAREALIPRALELLVNDLHELNEEMNA